jgi:Zn-dependent protease with chaperone function
METVNRLIHEKERTYFAVCVVIGGAVWASALVFVIFRFPVQFMIYGAIVALFLYISNLFFRANVFGNSVRVSKAQFPEIHLMAEEIGQALGMTRVPPIFVWNGQGATNAFAVHFLSNRSSYVIVLGDLVSLLTRPGHSGELRAVIGHELAHHAAGHLAVWRRTLLKPSFLVPFLGAAYRRSCELSADRIGAFVSGDSKSMKLALLRMASGNRQEDASVSVTDFAEQERDVPVVAGFLQTIFSGHPRLTKRVAELERQFGYQSVTVPDTARSGSDTPICNWELVSANGTTTPVTRQRFSIGRSQDSDLVISNLIISRNHCRIEVVLEDQLFVEDCGSKHGTFINEKRIERARIFSGDTLAFGPDFKESIRLKRR